MSQLNTPSEAPEFSTPPLEPIALAQAWFEQAKTGQVREPGALALATADAEGRAFNRIMQALEIRDEGVIFTTHTGSTKGRHLAHMPWSSGVLYWREQGRQLIVSGSTQPLPDEESDKLWAARPMGVRPMSSVAQQSETLRCESTLREKAAELSAKDQDLPRPAGFKGFLLKAELVEFWQVDHEHRLHQRLRYEYTSEGWRSARLQP